MKVTPTLMVLLGCCAIFLLTPHIPCSFLKMTVGNNVGSLLLILIVIYTLSKDMVLGLATFLAVASLFLENRRRIVQRAAHKRAEGEKKKEESEGHVKEEKQAPVAVLVVSSPNIVPGEVHPPRKDAEIEDYWFEPTDDSGTNRFENIDESFDDKQPLETVPPQPSEVSDFLQEKGLAETVN